MACATEAHGVAAITPGAWSEARLDRPDGDEGFVGPRAAVPAPGRPCRLQVASQPLGDGPAAPAQHAHLLA
jgi:hypothetical protein